MHEHVTINPDGSATIRYNLIYDFDDDMNGVYVSQETDQDVKLIGSPTATVNGQVVGNYSAGNRYGLEQKHDGDVTQFRVHYPVKADRTYQVTWTYQLANVAKRYQDVGEINWKIIGTNWQTDLQHTKIVIQLPKMTYQTLQAWTHSKSTTQFVVDKQAGTLTYEKARVNPDQPVEVHTMFDQAALSTATQRTGNRRSTILDQERAIAERAEKTAKRDKAMQGYVTWFAILPLGLLIRLIALWRRIRAQNKHVIETPHNYELPSDLPPAVVGWQLRDSGAAVSTLFSATLMDLLAKRVLTVSEEPTKKWRKTNYRIQLDRMIAFNDFEETLLTILFGEQVEVGKSIQTQTMQDGESAFAKRYTNKIDRFEDQVRRAAKPVNLIDHDAVSQLTQWQVWTIVAAVAVIVINGAVWVMSSAHIAGWFTGVSVGLSVLIAVVAFAMAVKIRRIYTVEGWPIAEAWFGFERMLRDVGQFEVKQVPDVMLWDRYLAYAVVLGVADKVADALRQAQLEPVDDMANFVPIYVAYTMFSPSSVSAYGVTSNGSDTGSSWGAGGSSGGFGGGSGGGAF
ncbi:DUF2207 domain-containing protein [Weissella confusa]|uniref:DUF2207 domain-containing protein n=1 Tax=Weissella fermenti TaxID=2987699 RepID=A0ABT6D389_9LACO|nr:MULTISPECIES: DUF2207 domain-containing protein [Weissella]MBJ7687864.1 DUF2207 domain-containing protein [Weissella confusa]MCW0926983.1 DUF2207 domain-containing protein [Weissella sp. LMG 11983]MDF9299419.1 DUF2207 domain-containing protein [Weissella sp. BK2]